MQMPLVEDDHGENVSPVLLVVVKHEVARRGLERKGFAKLLDNPRSGRMLGDADVEHGAACVVNDEEDVEHAEGRRGEDLAVVTQEVAPPLKCLAIGGFRSEGRTATRPSVVANPG